MIRLSAAPRAFIIFDNGSWGFASLHPRLYADTRCAGCSGVQPALPLMKSGGTFVIIGSTASISPPAGLGLYGGAKATVRCMVRSWIQDIKGSGIRINVLSAGAVDTRL